MSILRRFVVIWLVLALLVGAGVGLVLGWQVWPVSWYDTDPSDLKVEHQQAWITMAADAMAVNGNSELARQRLEELVDDETSLQDVANMVERVAVQQEQTGDGASALRLRRLALAAQLPAPSPDALAQQPTPRPDTVLAPSNTVVLLGALLIFVLAVGIVTWALIRLLRRRQVPGDDEEWLEGQLPAESAAVPSPAAERELVVGPEYAAVAPEPPMQSVSQPPTSLTPVYSDEYAEDEEADAYEYEEPEALEKSAQQETSSVAQPEQPGREVALGEDLDSMTDVPPDALGFWESEYRFGDDDFDTSFSIESESGDFLGECGMGVSDVLDTTDAQKIDAFEVWLFDKNGIHTEAKVLVSEFAYANEALNAQLSEKGELVVPEVALSFTLETLTLQMTVTIKDVSYLDDDDMPESAFERLAIEMLVERSE